MGHGAEQVMDASFLQEFFGGAEENLDQLEQALIRLETLKTPVIDGKLLGQLAMLLQELKDGAGLLGLETFSALAAAGEPVLVALENGQIKPTTAVLDGLLQMTEALKLLLAVYKAQGDDAAVETAEIAAVLGQLAQGEPEVVQMVAKPVEKKVMVAEKMPTVVPMARSEVVANVQVGPMLKRQGGVDKPMWLERRMAVRRQSERREEQDNH